MSRQPAKRSRGSSGAAAAARTLSVRASAVPPEWRRVFSFARFNAVQTACLPQALETDSNLLLVAPTGCGKTVAMELALIRMLAAAPLGKAVYIAPLRSLCAERHRDWSARFGRGTCVALTDDDTLEVGGSIHARLAACRVILTTAEKWDSVTRSWKHRAALVGQVSLLLIDEVHMLNDERGCALEVVVARMRAIAESTHVRVRGWPAATMRTVALSATVPNANDVAQWLRCPPEATFAFGDEMRGTTLTTHVLGYESKQNGFLFEKSLTGRVHSVVARYAEGKQCLVFCPSRPSTVKVAAQIVLEDASARCGTGAVRTAVLSATAAERSRLRAASAQLTATEPQLARLIAAGAAYHHAGTSARARGIVEGLFRDGALRVLCATSTLAQGINLPAFCVVVCSTQRWRGSADGYVEMKRAMLMQQIGRAGRPPYETRGTAVIMTQKSTQQQYRRLSGGLETIESQLHRQLAPYLNSEICLSGTIESVLDAIAWLKHSYLFVRLAKNPKHYMLTAARSSASRTSADSGTAASDGSGTSAADALLTAVNARVLRDITRLAGAGAIALNADGCGLRPRELGKIMARYMLHFETCAAFRAVARCSDIQELLAHVTRSADVVAELPVRRSEKKVLKLIGQKLGRFKTSAKEATIRSPAQKAFQLCQAAMGAIDVKRSASLRPDQDRVLERSVRVLSAMTAFFATPESQRAVTDIDARVLTASHPDAPIGSSTVVLCLVLRKCLRKRIWDNSLETLRQLDGVGTKTVALLSAAGISSFVRLCAASTAQIERACRRTPPFGANLQRQARDTLRCASLSALLDSSGATQKVHVAVTIAKPRRDGSDVGVGPGAPRRRGTAGGDRTVRVGFGDEDAASFFIAVVCGPHLLLFDRIDSDEVVSTHVVAPALSSSAAAPRGFDTAASASGGSDAGAVEEYARAYTITLPWAPSDVPSSTVKVHAIHSTIVGLDRIEAVVVRATRASLPEASAAPAQKTPLPPATLRPAQGRIKLTSPVVQAQPALAISARQRHIDEMFAVAEDAATVEVVVEEELVSNALRLEKSEQRASARGRSQVSAPASALAFACAAPRLSSAFDLGLDMSDEDDEGECTREDARRGDDSGQFRIAIGSAFGDGFDRPLRARSDERPGQTNVASSFALGFAYHHGTCNEAPPSANAFARFIYSPGAAASRVVVAGAAPSLSRRGKAHRAAAEPLPTPTVMRAKVAPPTSGAQLLTASRRAAPADVSPSFAAQAESSRSGDALRDVLSLARRRRAGMSSRTCVNPGGASERKSQLRTAYERAPPVALWPPSHRTSLHAPRAAPRKVPRAAPREEAARGMAPVGAHASLGAHRSTGDVVLAGSFIDASVHNAQQEWHDFGVGGGDLSGGVGRGERSRAGGARTHVPPQHAHSASLSSSSVCAPPSDGSSRRSSDIFDSLFTLL
jgi:ATP-dependent DNA helicase HFM1/MER3